MRTRWLLIGVGLLTAVLAVAAIACDDDDDDGGNGNGGVLRLAVTLTEVDGSGATGTADLSVNGEGILVSLRMAGLVEGVHANHLHHGTCDSQGDVHITLDPLVADADGNGSQTTGNNEQPLSHLETGHHLAVHEADGAPGVVVSCGDVVAP
jgi:hypothetical protein